MKSWVLWSYRGRGREEEGQRERERESKVGRSLRRAAGSRAPSWALEEMWELCELAPTVDTVFAMKVLC